MLDNSGGLCQNGGSFAIVASIAGANSVGNYSLFGKVGPNRAMWLSEAAVSYRRASRVRDCADPVPCAADRPFAFRPRRCLALIFLLLAAVFLPVASASAVALSGRVFVDSDFDGVWDSADEWVLPGITISLFSQNDPAGSTATDELGYYEFVDLAAGTYSIQQSYVHDDYINVKVCLGELLEEGTGYPLADGVGTVVKYDPGNNIMPKIADIGLADRVVGENFNFGQIWLGKFLYLARDDDPPDPPHANPTKPVPEPSTLWLLITGLIAFGAATRRRRGRGRP